MTNPPASAMRENILRIARRMLQTRSFLGFSFQDIADEVGIRKASLYHHFASKEALGVALLNQALQQFEHWQQQQQALEPQAKLQAFFSMYRDDLRAGSRVCPAGAFVAGWECTGSELQTAVKAIRDAQITWLRACLNELAPQTSSERQHQQALFIFASCQGALLAARVSGDVAEFDLIKNQLIEIVLT